MRIDIDDQLLKQISMEEIRLALGIWLYTEKDYSIGKAAEVAGLHKARIRIRIYPTDFHCL